MTTKARKIVSHIIRLPILAATLLVRSGYFIIAAIVIVGLTYLFGQGIVIGDLKGGDAQFAYSFLLWYARWFPHIPLWYPIQGGGYAHTLVYPIISTLLAIVIHNGSSYSLAQAMRLIVLGAYLFAAFGVYFLGAWRLRNQTLGLIGAILFLATPSVWFWMYKFGYYSYVIGMAFVPWSLLFYDWFLDSLIQRQRSVFWILKLFLAAVVYGITFIFHPFVGVSMAIAFLVYGPLVGWLVQHKRPSLRGLVLGVVSAFLVIGAAFLLFAFWFLPVIHYSHLTAAGGNQMDPADLFIKWAQTHSPQRLLFDYDIMKQDSVFLLPSFPRLLVYLVLLATPFLFIVRGRILGIAFLGWFFLFWSALAAYIPYNWVEKMRYIFTMVHYRVLFITAMFFPLVAGFAIYAIVWGITEIPFLPFYFIKHSRRTWVLKIIKGSLVSVLTLGIFISLFIDFEHGLGNTDYIGWEPVGSGYYFKTATESATLMSDLYNPSHYVSNIKSIQTMPAYKSIQNLFHQPFVVSSDVPQSLGKPLQDQMQLDQFTRVGLTGNIGNVLQMWGVTTDASTLNQFHHQGSLYQSMKGYFENVFFSKDTFNHDPALVADAADWAGYTYVITHKDDDNHQYVPQYWDLLKQSGAFKIYKFKNSQGMGTITQRPKVLVIGKTADAYEAVFRSSLRGVLPYKNAWLVRGKDKIDDYSLSDLKKFDGIILYGYSYWFGFHAFSLLDQYVKDGGKLFIDTGWQYISKEWQISQAPGFFPATSLVWSKDIPAGNYPLDPSQATSLGTATLPLEWNGLPWGLSVAKDLRSWAKPLLTINGETIIAGGDYGQGKVVWSGLNLYGYLNYQKYNPDLVRLGASVFQQLYPDYSEQQNLPQLTFVRTYPDAVDITVNGSVPAGSAVLWREPYTPDWHASLMTGNKNSNLDELSAGPGYLLLLLPATDGPSVIHLSFNLCLLPLFSWIISIFTLILFIVLFVDSLFNKGQFLQGFLKLFLHLPKRASRRLRKIQVGWQADEDY